MRKTRRTRTAKGSVPSVTVNLFTVNLCHRQPLVCSNPGPLTVSPPLIRDKSRMR